MRNSERLVWFEHAYDRLRADILPEAPPGITLTIAPIARKKTVGLCTFDVMHEHGEAFGGENIVTLHPLQGGDVVQMLATLAHEMIHAALPPEVKHGKPFIAVAKRIGLVGPWKIPTADLPLENKLRGHLLELERELGYVPVGRFEPKPPRIVQKKKSATHRIRCHCASPRVFTIPDKVLELGAIHCANCKEPFRVIQSDEERGK